MKNQTIIHYRLLNHTITVCGLNASGLLSTLFSYDVNCPRCLKTPEYEKTKKPCFVSKQG